MSMIVTLSVVSLPSADATKRASAAAFSSVNSPSSSKVMAAYASVFCEIRVPSFSGRSRVTVAFLTAELDSKSVSIFCWSKYTHLFCLSDSVVEKPPDVTSSIVYPSAVILLAPKSRLACDS